MIETLKPHKTGHGWIVEMPPEMAREAGLDEGSIVVLYASEGSITA